MAFAYTTAFPSDADGVLGELTGALDRRLRAGCVVCVTDGLLGDGFELLESVEGDNAGTGGVSVGYIYRKVSEGDAPEAHTAERVAALEARVDELEALLAERDARVRYLEDRLAAPGHEGET